MAPFLRRNEWLSIVYAIIFIALLVVGNNYGLTKVSDISTLYTSVLFTSIISVLIWGFKARFEKDHGALAKVEEDLRTHYKGIIDRMATWEYQPNERGNIINNPGGVQPPSLKEDLEHLKTFEKAWRLYGDGPEVDRRFNTADAEAKKITKYYLRTMVISSGLSFINWTVDGLVRDFSSAIILKVELELRINRKDDFVVTASSHIGNYHLEGNLHVQQFAQILNTIKHYQDVREAIEKRFRESDEVEQNKTTFIDAITSFKYS